MTSPKQMEATIALANALQRIEDADTLLRPVSEFLLEQADTECDLQVPEVR